MSTPLRVNDSLFKEARAEASLMCRSTAKQIEYWAELGRQVAHSVTPADIVALMQGIAKLRIEVPASHPLDPEQVFSGVDKLSSTKQFGQKITRKSMYYEASQRRPGYLDRVMPDGSRGTGRFSQGAFLPE